MGKQAWMACAVGLCFVLVVGCSTLDLAGLFALNNDGNERVITGSLEGVAKSTQSALTQVGFTAIQTRNGDTIRIASKTAGGKSFTVVLKSARGPNGEETTRVRIEWDGEGDQQIGLQLLAQIETAARR
jgi:hypothetical protein